MNTNRQDTIDLRGEDRRKRLYEALTAYDDALRFIRPENAPLDYAQTQNNRAVLLSDLASLPGEDRGARLRQALAAYDEALAKLRDVPLDYASTQNNRAILLSAIATLPGEDRRARLTQALRCAAEAVALFQQFQQAQYLEVGKRVLQSIRRACGDDFAALWAAAGLGEPPDWLLETEDTDSSSAMPALAERAQAYMARLQAADAENPQVAEWQAITALGERLLAMQPGAENLLNWNALREQIASDYNTLGNAHDRAGDKAASLAAFERAIALQPDFAMWRRNQAGTLIDLGRLDAAGAALDQARALQPDAPRLADLQAALAKAQEGGS